MMIEPPLRGEHFDALSLGDIHESAGNDDDLWFYYDGPLLWVHTLPDGNKAIVSWVYSSEDSLTDRYYIYVYRPAKFEVVRNNLEEHNLPLKIEYQKADEIYAIDWRMHKDDFRILDARRCSWAQLEKDFLPTDDATLYLKDTPGD